MKKYFLFTTLAANQTEFFKSLAIYLKSQGHEAGVVCFHERSVDLLKTSNVDTYNIFEVIRKSVSFGNDLNHQFSNTVSKYQFPDSHVLFAHEGCAFNLFDREKLQKKFIGYTEGFALILNQIKSRFHGEVIVIQELGGFSSLLSALYVSRAFKLQHYFLEPAFYKGRCFILENTWESLKVKSLADKISPEVESYIKNTISNRKIVIPDKDKFHYLGLFSKIFRIYNFRRLFEKIFDRYLFGKEEEFRYVWNYTWRHTKMFICKFMLNSYYREVPQEAFVYFPLHVPMDISLTIRSPHCLDQYHLIDLICRSLPLNMKLVIKEHPAMVGVLELGRMQDILRKNKNLVLLRPTINNYDVLGKCEMIVTVNSKSGAEGLALGQKVLVLGDAFYSYCPLVKHSTDLGQIESLIRQTLNSQSPDMNQVNLYFESVWRNSFPGEIYNLDEENVSGFGQQILKLGAQG